MLLKLRTRPKALPLISALLLMLIVAIQPAASAQPNSDKKPECRNINVPVSLNETDPKKHNISGTLCSQGPPAGKPIQLLVHGGTYNRVYWDFPYQPDHYSYVRSATQNGYATLAIDRLGSGTSSKPPSPSLTVAAGAHAVHDVIQALRRGQVAGGQFEKVILVGHSVGSLVSKNEAATYHDVDALVMTGWLGNYAPVGVGRAFTTFYPAQLDPKFRDKNLPVGYATTRPGTRGIFYNRNFADPNVIQVDDQTKGLYNEIGETFVGLIAGQSPAVSRSVDVPVLSVVGEYDAFFCTTVCGKPPVSNSDLERLVWTTPDFTQKVMPNNAHNLNLHRNSQDTFSVLNSWINDRFK